MWWNLRAAAAGYLARRRERNQRWKAFQRCPLGGYHNWTEFTGYGAAGFQRGLICNKCGEEVVP